MTNFQVYKKTLCFSLAKFLIDIIVLIIVLGLASAGYFIFDKTNDHALIGLSIGLALGIVIAILVHIFISNKIKAAQIGMMAVGVVDGQLPDNVYSEGLNLVKGRCAKITLFFMVTGAIKGMFRQVGRATTKLGKAVGGNVGEGVGSAIDSAIQIVIGYLCDCCLGWVMYRKDTGTAKAACEGAVIFFKHGKTLIRNIGRIFGMGILSFVLVGGAFFGLFFLILRNFPNMFEELAKEIVEIGIRNNSEVPAYLTDITNLTLIVSGIIAIILWTMIHNVLIRPFILVGVLRNFMTAGLSDTPKEEDFATLDGKSRKFAKLHSSI